ncbi:MAG: deoxyribodipyrimidine photo-lyase, partial [Myxococcota bacterium]
MPRKRRQRRSPPVLSQPVDPHIAAHSDVLGQRLAERVRAIGGPHRPVEPRSGEFVLYWMRTAARAEDNPALDAALRMADALAVPALVYHALSERYPYANDRHHTFILEGARDVAAGLRERGIAYAFHLDRPGHRGPHLVELAGRAALLITEDMPVQPLRGWTEAVAARVDTPVWCVDTACIVPMRLSPAAFDRAFEFRRWALPLWRDRLGRPPSAPPPSGPSSPPAPTTLPALPFAAIDLATADLPALVASCAIDHTVAPVPDSRGGSRAGYQRWAAFAAERLRSYHRRRNDPNADGVSRMSAYLHYGHVSPQRLADEAAQRGGPGADKYLDELLVWRELAYHYCFHQPDHERVDALPHWAVSGMEARRSDPRPALLSWESLARGRTGDPLWDA